MNRVTTNGIKLEDYSGIVSEQLLTEISQAGEKCKGLRVINISASSHGGNADEILKSLTPLMCDAGIDARWYTLTPDESFHYVCRMLQRYLQGRDTRLSASDIELYLANNEKAANTLSAMGVTADIWLFHDFQVLPMLSFMGPYNGIWICHDGINELNAAVREMLFPHMMNSRMIIASLPEYFPNGHSPCEVAVIPPAIDPLQPRHGVIPGGRAREVLAGLGMDPARPIIGQVSPFNDLSELLSVIDACRLARKEIYGLQLAMVGVPAARDGQESREVIALLRDYINGDPDIHIFYDSPGVGEGEINALQSGADVIVQQPAGNGFDLRVTEAMWKERPVIGGNHGGIRLQIRDGLTGFMADDARTCASRIITLLRDPTLAALMANAARESVRRRYLMPRLLRDYLQLFSRLLDQQDRAYVAAAGVSSRRV
jgi:trehalose synthase